MKCVNCGVELPENAQFCGNCGATVTEQSQQAPAAQQPFAQTASNPADYVSAGELPSYTSVPAPVKKKSKLVPILAVTGSVAAVGVAGTIIGINCKSAVKRTLMGENKYAASVMDNTVDKFIGDTSSKDIATGIKAASETMITVASSMSDLSGSNEEMMLYALSSALDTYGDTGVAATLGFDIKPSDKIKDSLKELCDDYLDVDGDAVIKAVDYFGSTYMSVDQKFTDDAYACAFRFGAADDELLDLDFYYDKKGDCYISFPSASKTAIHAELPELPEIDAKNSVEVDEKEVVALLDSIDKVIDAAFESADVEVSEQTLTVGKAKYKGTCVEAVFDAELIGDTIVEIAKTVEDRDFIADIIEEVTGEDIDLSEIVSEAESLCDEIADYDFKLVVRNYVTSTDKVVGTEIVFGNDEADIIISALDTKEYFAIAFEIDDKSEYGYSDCLISLVAEKENEKSGSAVLKVTASGVTFDIDIDYSDLGTTQYMGMNYPTGTFVITLGSSIIDMVPDESFSVGDEDISVKTLLKKSSIIVKSAKKDNGIRFDMGIDNGDYGYYGVFVEYGDSKAKVASSYKDVIEIDDFDDEGIEFIAEVAENYITKILGVSELSGIFDELDVKDIDDLLSMTGYGDFEDFIEDFLYYAF